MENEEKSILTSGTEAAAGIESNPVAAPEAATAEAPAAASASFAGIVGDDGALADNWRDLLPEDIRNEPSLGSIKHFGALAKSYVHAQKAIGANKIAIPGENATDDEKAAFYQAIGRPEEPEKYEFKPAADLPGEIEFNDELMKGFREEAFRIGLTGEQFNAAVNFQARIAAGQMKAQQEAAEAEYASTLSKLKGEFGGRYDEVIAQCNKAVETFGLGDVLREHGLLNNYAFIKALAGIGEKISEAKLKGDPGSAVQSDPASRLAEITGNLNDPYYNREHSMHAQRVDEVNRLIAQQRQR